MTRGDRTFGSSREVYQQDMVAWSDSVASNEKEVVWRGLNRVHPIFVGYDNLSRHGEDTTRRLAAA